MDIKRSDSGSRWGAYALICVTHTLLHTFTQMHLALIPVLRSELGLTAFTIGLMASIPLLIRFIVTIPSGIIADKFDRLQIMAFSLLISALGGILMFQVKDFPSLIVFVSLFSISSTLLHPPALSLVSDLISTEKRGKALGFFNSAGTLGIALGPITLSLLIQNTGWRLVYLLWSVPVLLLPLLILLLRLDKLVQPEGGKEGGGESTKLSILFNLSLILLLAILGTRAMSGNAINTYITPFFVDVWRIEAATASLIFGIRPLVGILAAPMGGTMVDRIGAKRWIALGLLFQIFSISGIAFSTSFPVTMVSYLSYSFFAIMEMPAVQSLITQLTPQTSRGLVYSLTFLPSTITGAVSPIVAAFIVEAWGIWHVFPFALSMIITAISTLALLWSRLKEGE